MTDIKVGRELRNMGHLPRWAIIQKVKHQSVAEHCFFVTMYAERFMEHLDIWTSEFKYKVLVACQRHDLEELLTGDIAGPSKKYMFNDVTRKDFERWQTEKLVERFPWYTVETDPDVLQVMNFADYLEGGAYLAENVRLGCTDAIDVFNVYIEKMWLVCEKTDSILGLSRGESKKFAEAVLNEIIVGNYKVVV